MRGSTWGAQEQGTGPHTAYEPHHTLAQSLAWPAPKPGLGCPEAPAQSFDHPSDAHLKILLQVLLLMAPKLSTQCTEQGRIATLPLSISS